MNINTMSFFKQLIILTGLVAALAISSALAVVFASPKMDTDSKFEALMRTCQEANRQAMTMSGSTSMGIENSQRAAVLVTCRTLQNAYSKRYQNAPDALKEAAYQALERGTIVEKVDPNHNSRNQLALVRQAIYDYLLSFENQ